MKIENILWISFIIVIQSFSSNVKGQQAMPKSYSSFLNEDDINVYYFIDFDREYRLLIDQKRFIFENHTDRFVAIGIGFYHRESCSIIFDMDTVITQDICDEIYSSGASSNYKYSPISRFKAYRDWEFVDSTLTFSIYNLHSQEKLYTYSLDRIKLPSKH